MNPLTAQELRGTWATLLLPINADESIDYSRLSDEIDCLTASGVDGIYSNGTAGEFYAQSEDEFDAISELLAQKCERAGLPFQIGACHTSAQNSLSRARRAAALKPCAIQVILPDWVAVTLDEAIAFLRRVADVAEQTTIVLYNPPHAKRILKPEEYKKLCDAIPALVGIKVLDGDESWYAAMRPLMARLSIFVPGHHLATGIKNGVAGSYSNVACLHPVGAKKWNDLMDSDLQSALKLESRLQQFMAQHIAPYRDQQGYSNQALDKLLAAVGEWSEVGTRLRFPYKWIDEREARRLRPIAEDLVPEVFA